MSCFEHAQTAGSCLAAMVMVLCASSAFAQGDDRDSWYAGDVRASAGFDFRTGDFGRDGGDTDIWSVPVSLEYRFRNLGLTPRDRIRIKVAIPYLRIEGPDRGEANEAGAEGLDEGIGDLSIKLGYLYTPSSNLAPYVELSGKVKVPTASEKDNLGTGKVDFTLEGQLSRPFRVGRYRVTPFASLGHKWVGEPDGRPRRNTLRGSAGAVFRFNRRLSFGTRYAWRESSVRGRGDRHELLPFLGIGVSDRIRLSPYGLLGLSTRAADWGGGLQIRLTQRIQ